MSKSSIQKFVLFPKYIQLAFKIWKFFTKILPFSIKNPIDNLRGQVRTGMKWVERITGTIHHLHIVSLKCKTFLNFNECHTCL